ncbi:preprotein translocase subunit SecY [candidate division WWE3 bacterium]|uniref:Protein translocase subunit SecY n=1 Tax=candidate division WWE3 bacterium TaxID=2053526 RepID=A0A955LKW1_UNCKA|nr:preprotein translocase subunit SecY [candidate division WWE3 bacterium]
MENITRIVRNAWATPDLRRKIIFTLIIVFVYRIVAHVPLPGVDLAALRELFAQSQFLGLLNMFSGGALSNFSIVALGLNPYINASIVFQLAGMVIPKIEELQKDEAGQRKLNQYQRLLTVPLAAIQSLSVYFILRQSSIIQSLSAYDLLAMVITLTAGALLAVWLGELLTEYGIGNGVSVLITVGIISGLPTQISQLLGTQASQNSMELLMFLGVSILTIAGIVLVNEAIRQIPVQYARRVRGGAQTTSQMTYLPLRLNQAGVIPIIFAVSLVLIPGTVANFLSGLPYPQVASVASSIARIFDSGSVTYVALYFILVVAFTFFYTAVTFNPDRISENLQKQGGFIPGVRPGQATSEYLNRLLTRITVPGSIFLGLVAILPIMVRFVFPDIGSIVTLGGTSLLIIVSVAIETIRSMESMMVMRGYEKFIS